MQLLMERELLFTFELFKELRDNYFPKESFLLDLLLTTPTAFNL